MNNVNRQMEKRRKVHSQHSSYAYDNGLVRHGTVLKNVPLPNNYFLICERDTFQ